MMRLNAKKKMEKDFFNCNDLNLKPSIYLQPHLQKYFLLLTFLFLLLIVVFNLNLISSQEATYCAERTIYGAWCQNVPLKEVNTSYRYDRTSCESTTYCSTGTCANTATGECIVGPRATCNPEEGGFFYDKPKDEVAQCKVGCCLLGDGASLVERVRCDVLGKDYGVKATFRQDITDEATCLSLASPEAKGACVFETERGRDCRFETKEECQNSNGEFHEGFLCTAPELGTICTKTKRTTCVPGKNEVYFIDSCGNLANVYDANKIDDIIYWSFVPGVEGVEIDLGDGKGNAGSPIYGACDYFEGTTCGPGNAKYGRNICVDLRCAASSSPLTGGITRKHGEEWCSEPIKNFENAKPGQLSYLLYCYNGKVQYELCDPFRNKLCLENEEEGTANCVPNRWADCIFQNNTRDCLDVSVRDCKIEEGAGLLRTQYGTEKQILNSDTGEMMVATCVPKYPPGFKFWDPEGTMMALGEEKTPSSICGFSSITCFVNYTQEILGVTSWRATPEDSCIEACKQIEGWSDAQCYKACTPVCLENLESKNANATIVQKWAQDWQNLCTSIGDCGVAANYLGKEGYNRWRDLFTGNKIDWKTLPNAENRK